MTKLKLLCLAIVLLCLASAAHAQAPQLVQYSGYVAPAGYPFGPATIAVCASGGSGGPPCSPLTIIYTDASGTRQQPNPFTIDPQGNGNFHFFANCGTNYALQSYGNGYTTILSTITTSVCTGGGGGTPTGPASGDLNGSYPAPNVVKINAAAVPTSKTIVGTNASGQIVDASSATLSNPIAVLHNASCATITGTTPSVGTGNCFVTGNGSATTITNFTGGVDSQSIHVNCGDANTTIANNANIVAFSGSNIICVANQAYEFTFYSSLGKWVQLGGSGTPGGSPIQTQVNNAGAFGGTPCQSFTSLATGPINWGCNVSTTGNANVALKVNMPGGFAGGVTDSGGIQYVSITGNDANDGMSWGTAKLTINAAICSLPHGNCASSPRITGVGTVYVQDGVWADANHNIGTWIAACVGPGDSTCISGTAHPPAGWMTQYGFTGSLSLICASHAYSASNDHLTRCQIPGAGTGNATYPGSVPNANNLPLIWLSGSAGVYVEGLMSIYVPMAWVGVDSTGKIFGDPATGNYGFGQAISITLNNTACYLPAPVPAGMGPCYVEGANYWNHIWNSIGAGSTGEMFQATNFSRTSGVTTVTVNGSSQGNPGHCPFIAGDTITVFNIVSGDSSFAGTYTVATGCAGGSTFTYNQNANLKNSTNSSPGGQATVVSNRSWAFLLTGTQIEMRDLHTNGGGGIKFAATDNSNLQLKDVYVEGDNYSEPTLYISNPGSSLVQVSGIFLADTGALPGLINEGAPLIDDTIQSQTYALQGPGVHLNESKSFTRLQSYTANSAIGNYGNYLEAHMDTARRTGAPNAVRFPNIVNNQPAACGASNLVVTSGQTDPFGGTAAYQLTSTSGTSSACFFNSNLSFNIGDIFVGGLWIRRGDNLPLGSALINVGLGGSGDLCTNLQASNTANAVYSGDGNWEWLTVSCTIYTNPTLPSLVSMYINVANPANFWVAYPYFAKVPAGSISNNELQEFINDLPGGFSSGAAAGDIAFLPGQKLCVPSGVALLNNTCGYFVHTDTANRTYTMPDASGTVLLSSTAPSYGSPPNVYDNFDRSSLNTGGPCPTGTCYVAFGNTLATIVGNQVSYTTPDGTSTSGAFLNYAPAGFGLYQFSQYVVTGDVSVNSYYQLYTNLGDNSVSYTCRYSTNTNQTQIQRNAVNVAQGTFGLADGDVVRCETAPPSSGSGVTVSLKRCAAGAFPCTTELTYTDTSPPTPLGPQAYGMGGFGLGGFAIGVTPSFDNFEAGPLGPTFAALDVEQVWTKPQHFPNLTVGPITPAPDPLPWGYLAVGAFADYAGSASAPANPSAGYCRQYFNTTTGFMTGLTSSGGACTPGGLSGMTSGQIAIAGGAASITSSKAVQGTDASILSSGTVTGTAATLCTDANGGATTVGCTGGAISGMSTGQVAIAGSASSITSSKPLQGTDSNILTSSTIATGAGNLLCTDTGSGATTSGCAVFNTQSAATNTNIAATNMVASTNALHSYLFQWTISLTAVGVGCTSSTTINMNAIFTDPNVSTTTTELLGQITIAAGGNGTLGFVAQGTDNILAKTTTAVQYSTTGYTAGTGCTTNPTYQVTPTLVQLW